MTPPHVVFLVDVANTLLESDGVKKDLRRCLKSELGDEKRDRSLAIVEEWRPELGPPKAEEHHEERYKNLL